MSYKLQRINWNVIKHFELTLFRLHINYPLNSSLFLNAHEHLRPFPLVTAETQLPTKTKLKQENNGKCLGKLETSKYSLILRREDLKRFSSWKCQLV